MEGTKDAGSDWAGEVTSFPEVHGRRVINALRLDALYKDIISNISSQAGVWGRQRNTLIDAFVHRFLFQFET